MDIFSRDGYTNAKLQDIADLAGISRSPIYNYFGDKLNLYKAVIQSFFENRQILIQNLFDQNENIFEALSKDFELTCREDACKCVLMMGALYTELQNERDIREYVDDINEKIRTIKYNAIAKAVKEGQLRQESNVNEIVDMIYVFVNGLLANESKWFLKGNNYYMLNLMQSLLAMIWATYGI